MNIFGGFGNGMGGRGGCGIDCCSIIWLLFLLSICGCGRQDCDNEMGGGFDGCSLIVMILLLSCLCGGHSCHD